MQKSVEDLNFRFGIKTTDQGQWIQSRDRPRFFDQVGHQTTNASTLVCRIDVHARLLILRKKYPMHGLILVCTFNVL